MKTATNYIFPIALIVIGGALLILGAQQGQNTWVMLGAALALLAGAVSLLLQLGIITKSMGTIIGIVFGLGAVFLAYRNYRSIAEVIEFNEQKRENDRLVIQGLKDIRTAQAGYKQSNGTYTGDLNELRNFVKNGRITMVRAIGQVPDTLNEKEALQLGIIVRDTILAPALDSLFLTKRALDSRVYDFNPDNFIYSPVKKDRMFLLQAGSITSSGRNVPVFLAKDPAPMVVGDTLMVGSMEKANTAGNWAGE